MRATRLIKWGPGHTGSVCKRKINPQPPDGHVATGALVRPFGPASVPGCMGQQPAALMLLALAAAMPAATPGAATSLRQFSVVVDPNGPTAD
eukprot:SAG31_NODE_35948_length_318_cov_0.703196_1_plen_91_part_01